VTMVYPEYRRIVLVLVYPQVSVNEKPASTVDGVQSDQLLYRYAP